MVPLKGRKVILFPDVQGFTPWTKRAQELAPMLDIKVSDLLERKATDQETDDKLDLADYLLRFEIEDFIKPTVQQFHTLQDGTKIPLSRKGYPMDWETATKQVSLLERMINKYPKLQILIERLDLTSNMK